MVKTDEGTPPIVCISDLFWDEHWGVEQQLMSRLAAYGRVLYVERPVSFLSFFTGSSDGSIPQQIWRWLRGGMRTEEHSVTVLTPPPFLPFRYNRFVNSVNQRIRLRAVRRAMRRLNIKSPVLWTFEPDAGKMVGALGEAFSLYYCADDWDASVQWWNASNDVRTRESELASKVDLVVCTATKLVQKLLPINLHTILVTNGVDVSRFRVAREPDLVIPEDLARIPAPRIGYIGFVNGRFDARLWEYLAERRPEWHWVVVGPLMESHVNLSRLRQKRNVHFLGPRSRSTLPGYLKGFDVCTIPYVYNRLAESICPLKLFEYLAAGRPVVSTALPEVAALSPHVLVARTPEEFEQNIQQALCNPPVPASESSLAEHCWDTKVALLVETISRTLQARRCSIQ